VHRSVRLLTGLALVVFAAAPAVAAEPLNVIAWCDHTEPALLEPFEKANDAKVNIKTIESTGMALAILDQSQPGDWDLFAIDGIDVRRIIDRGLAEPLDEAKLPLADLAPEMRLDQYVTRDGKRYAVVEKYGTNSYSLHTDKVAAEDARTLSTMWNPKYKGRVAMTDYYMPVIGMAALALGKKTSGITAADLPAIKEVLLKIKANAKGVLDVASGSTQMATGDVDLLIGGGEWVSAGLAKDNPKIDFAIPDEGALAWTQAAGIFAASPRKALAHKFIEYVMSPEGQGRLATASCFWGVPVNKRTVLDDQAKKLLHMDRQPEYLKRLQTYPTPDEALDKQMQDLWTDVLQAK
jgi:spermidine/putrescine transport system substrate-binding protein